MNRHTTLILAIVGSLCLKLQCAKDYHFPPIEHRFIQKVSISPARKTYHLGDTILLTFKRPEPVFFDSLTQTNIAVDSTSMSFTCNLVSPDFPYDKYPEARLYDCVVDNNGEKKNYWRMNVGFQEVIGCQTGYTFNFTAAVILTEKGRFAISLADEGLYSCSQNSEAFGASVVSFRFDVADWNEELLPEFTSVYSYAALSANNGQSFFFVVEE